MTPIAVARWSTLADCVPTGALVADVDLVIVRYGNEQSVLYGRCLHRGALMADGTVIGGNLVCGLHGWDYSYRTGISSYDDSERLHRFTSWVDVAADQILVDADEIAEWAGEHPQPYDRTTYQGAYQDPHGAPEEPFVGDIRELATSGLTKVGHHGPLTAMGVARDLLPAWDSIQIVTAQLSTRPLLDDEVVGTDVTIGPEAILPLRLDLPLFVSDMSLKLALDRVTVEATHAKTHAQDLDSCIEGAGHRTLESSAYISTTLAQRS